MRVDFLPRARRAFNKLPQAVQVRLQSRLDALGEDPYPPGREKVEGEPAGVYRIRVGDFGVLYLVRAEESVVWVAAIGPRKHVYKRR
jgi:mRNA interferase RelE/StbE